jgi:mono/diheme cytochrome c family protein
LPAATPAAQENNGERRSVWDGVYSLEQAKRGEAYYDEQCASCHQFDLEGDGLDVPALTTARFRDKWDRRSLRRLFDVISMSMPQQKPGSLTRDVYADIVSYILQKNEFPAGSQPLSIDPNALEAIALERQR